MKIGLVRHFKVKHNYPTSWFVSKEEVLQWFEGYENAEIEYQQVNMGEIGWTSCYTSPSARAIKTADAVFSGNNIKTNALRELNILPLLNTKISLPFLVWAILVRIRSFSSNMITEEFKTRLFTFLDTIISEDNENVLIVSHGFVMMFLRKELLRRGFTGPGMMSPVHRRVYVFEKD
ncbi:MAG: histidine phosphatase family protein [Saprospiraceae bacterium]